jgi:hypothetical protein
MLKATEQKRLYEAFTYNYRQRDLISRRTALDAGKEFIARYKDEPMWKEVVTFINRQIPQLERSVQRLERNPRVRRRTN